MFLLILVLALILALPCSACTLYSAAGEAVEGGGTLIVKNRDYRPQIQKIRKVRDGKYKYLGLFNQRSDGKWTLRSGVNEKGLAAVTAMASCLPKAERQRGLRKTILSYVLKNCASVEEALGAKERFFGPKFVMLADAKEIAIIEIGQDGQYTIERKQNGTLAHTNYYLEPKFQNLNMRVGESSKERYKRITKLLDEGQKPYTLEQFYEFSQDKNAGSDNSIWRFGSDPKKSQTLASFVISISPEGKVKGIIKYRAKPHQQGRERVFRVSV